MKKNSYIIIFILLFVSCKTIPSKKNIIPYIFSDTVREVLKEKMKTMDSSIYFFLEKRKDRTNMTAQMIGKATISFYPIGKNVLVFVTDSKSKNSVNPIYKLSSWITNDPNQHNVSRESTSKCSCGHQYPSYMGTTRQTYIFSIPKNKISNYGSK